MKTLTEFFLQTRQTFSDVLFPEIITHINEAYDDGEKFLIGDYNLEIDLVGGKLSYLLAPGTIVVKDVYYKDSNGTYQLIPELLGKAYTGDFDTSPDTSYSESTASKYDYPQKYVRWQINDRKLEIVTNYIGISDPNTNKTFSAIDETLAKGIVVKYEGAVPKIDITKSEKLSKHIPAISERLHTALYFYIMSRRYEIRAANEFDLGQSKAYYARWWHAVTSTDGGKPKSDKAPVIRPNRNLNMLGY